MTYRKSKPPRAQYQNTDNLLHFPLRRPHKTDDAAYAELTVALVRRQHELGQLNPAILDAMMSAIGLPV